MINAAPQPTDAELQADFEQAQEGMEAIIAHIQDLASSQPDKALELINEIDRIAREGTPGKIFGDLNSWSAECIYQELSLTRNTLESREKTRRGLEGSALLEEELDGGEEWISLAEAVRTGELPPMYAED